jgi:hypothetical protein
MGPSEESIVRRCVLIVSLALSTKGARTAQAVLTVVAENYYPPNIFLDDGITRVYRHPLTVLDDGQSFL